VSRTVTDDDHAMITLALHTEGGHLSIGHAGFTLWWKGGWLSGYVADELKAACIARGLPARPGAGRDFNNLCANQKKADRGERLTGTKEGLAPW